MKFSAIISFIMVISNAQAESALDISAAAWCQEIIHYISPADKERLLNLLYWSFMRSWSTLVAQEAWINDQQIASQTGYLLTSTRLNPARRQLYTFNPHALLKNRTNLIDAIQQHERIGAIYTECLNDTIEKRPFAEPTNSLVKELRQAARKEIAQALSEELYNLQEMLHMVQKTIEDTAHLYQQQRLTRSKSSKFLSYLWDYFPTFMIKTFVTFDNEFTDINHQLWQALIKSEQMGNYLWRIIEKRRAEFYAAYYTALHGCITSVDTKPYVCLFGQQQGCLPTPENLPVIY